MSWRVDVGDCVELMAAMPACSVDAVVCDPPYGLEFMGKEWDRLWRDRPVISERGRRFPDAYLAGKHAQEWHRRWAVEALRVLKPGGHLLAFGGTRTSHRLACALEDAGFEIRDTICWLYGSGFPKSLDVGKAIDKQAGAAREVLPGPVVYGDGHVQRNQTRRNQSGRYNLSMRDGVDPDPQLTAPATPDAERWDGWGTALKPAHEPIVVARKPLAGTVAANVLEHGTGGLNVDGCRVATSDPLGGGTFGGIFGNGKPAPDEGSPLGRWPANVVLDEQAATMLDQQSGDLGKITGGRPGAKEAGRFGAFQGLDRPVIQYPDSGGASRFFYTAKASRAERNAGLDGFEERTAPKMDGGHFVNPERGTVSTETALRNHHPTVKPVSLMRWLVRLVTPPGGLVLDPFTGSGTTGIAAVLEGFNFAGMEQDDGYADIARARVGWWELHGHDALRIVAEQEAAENEREAVRQSGQLELL